MKELFDLENVYSEIVYQYQQAYVPNNGNIFHFWVDCTKEIHDEEAREGGTVRTLYAAPPAPVLKLPDVSEGDPGESRDIKTRQAFYNGFRFALEEVKRLNIQPSPTEASNEQ